MNNNDTHSEFNQSDFNHGEFNQSGFNLQTEIERRRLLKGFGALMGASLVGSAFISEQAYAQQAASGLMNRSLSQKELQGEPFVFDEHGPFDMDDSQGNYAATFKITNNLIGAKTYVPMFSRVLIGPQGKPGSVIHGHIGMWTWQLQKPDKELAKKIPEGSFIQRALFTGMILDPFTYEPVDRVYNKYLDKEVNTEDSVFAESYIFFPNGTIASIDRPEFMSDPDEKEPKKKTYVRWGDEISIFLDGIFQNTGPNQPRMDTSTWTTSYKDLMNPNKALIKTDYNFAGLMRAWERPWMGVGKDDDTQLLWNVKGTKMHSVDDMPKLILDNIVKKYPDRV